MKERTDDRSSKYKRAMACLLVLLLGFATLLDVTSVGEPSHQRYGVGAQWLLYGQRYSFYGVTGRMWEQLGLVEKQRHLFIVYPSKLRVSTDIQLKIG
jgi:hypothetical protein